MLRSAAVGEDVPRVGRRATEPEHLNDVLRGEHGRDGIMVADAAVENPQREPPP